MHVLLQNRAHAAAGSGQGHLHLHLETARRQRLDVTVVNEAKVHDVHRYLGIETGAHLVPDFLFDLLLRHVAAANRGLLFGHLQPERIRVFAFDAEHVSVDDDRVAAAERLRDVRLLALLEGDLRADRNDGRFHVPVQYN